MSLTPAVVLALLIGTPVGGQTPPIFNPGAPGQASRVISANEAVALSRTTFNAADVAFMQHMIVHHAQAVEMVELLRAQGADATVKLLGERIALSQAAEMAIMREWLTVRGQSVDMPAMDHAAHTAPARAGAHDHHSMTPPAQASTDDRSVMSGMLSPRQMRTLAASRGTAFDRLFLQGMIQHHQGAIDMVDDLLATPDAAEDPTLSDFASAVVAEQSAEILRMQNLLSDL
ncbi:MAG: DUF305 domain-containing protein [Brevundimonas sp.]|uniref:DUF305 domain-containing protein n=1 Tax=Brevundimonas sp. TaxID=1871086 RepID=UPI003919C342